MKAVPGGAAAPAAPLSTMEREYAGRHAVGAAAFRFDGRRPSLSRPAPTLGQHTAEVLAGAAPENETAAPRC